MKKNSVTDRSAKGGKGFLSGVFVLSLSTLIVKLIGLAVKIPMMSLLGAEGMGYFNSAYEIYAMLCVISTAGLPVALSMLISAALERDDFSDVKRIYRSALSVFVVIGAFGSFIMIAFADKIADLIGNPDCKGALMAIAPALLFVCIASAYRGYFQGFCCMTHTAISQLIEAISKLALGVLFTKLALDAGYGIPIAAAAAIAGITLGTMLSALYLFVVKLFKNKGSDKKQPKRTEKNGRVIATLLKIAVPITLSSAVLSITRITDMALIMRRLQNIGYTTSGANAIYGSYTTLAVPIFGLVPSLITPIALALVPELSAAIERRSENMQMQVTSSSLRITVLFAMPASMGVAVFARSILELLFPKESDAISVASPLLSLLGISILFACLITTTNAILQSYRRTTVPIVSMAIGAAVKFVSAYILIGIPEIGVFGAPVSTLICNVTISAINLYYINKCVGGTDDVFGMYVKPFFASCVMITASFAAYLAVDFFTENEVFGFLSAMPVAAVAYIAFVFLFGAVSREDILMLPAGSKILLLLERFRILKINS